eukprot:3806326-Rhodomonas_salina.1
MPHEIFAKFVGAYHRSLADQEKFPGQLSLYGMSLWSAHFLSKCARKFARDAKDYFPNSTSCLVHFDHLHKSKILIIFLRIDNMHFAFATSPIVPFIVSGRECAKLTEIRILLLSQHNRKGHPGTWHPGTCTRVPTGTYPGYPGTR